MAEKRMIGEIRTVETGPAAWRALRPLAVVTGAQMAEIDRRAQSEWALPGSILMENAGANAYAAVRAHLWDSHPAGAPGTLAFVAGRGNNGGDALVMARHAHLAGAEQAVVVLAGGEPRGGTAAAANLAACRALSIPVLAGDQGSAALRRAEWIFDGITGTGLRSTLAEPLGAAWWSSINAARARRGRHRRAERPARRLRRRSAGARGRHRHDGVAEALPVPARRADGGGGDSRGGGGISARALLADPAARLPPAERRSAARHAAGCRARRPQGYARARRGVRGRPRHHRRRPPGEPTRRRAPAPAW